MDSSETEFESESKSNYAQNGKLLLASATLLFLLLLAAAFLHAFRRSCSRTRRRRRVSTNSTAVNLNHGIHPSLLASLPTFTHSSSSSDAAAGDECAVCMSEFSAGDDCRALPTCRHAFHSDCIDAWFRSHSNCPLCRTPVQLPVRSDRNGSGDVESALPEPVWCTRKPLRENYCVYAPPEALVDHTLKLYHQNQWG